MNALRTLSLAACLAALVPFAAQAGTWRYDLKPGTTYRYQYRGHDEVDVTMPMMGTIKTRIDVATDYGLKVVRRLPDGRFDVEILLERVIMKPEGGAETTLADLPPQVRRMRAYLTPRGRFQFYERVVLEVVDGGGYALGVIRGDKGAVSSQVTASDGEEEVTLTASIDPKTGRVSAGVQKRKARKQTRKVETERQVQHVDLLPADVLALMELPEGPVTPGMTTELKAPMVTVRGTAGKPEPCGKGACGRLHIVSATEADTKKLPGASAEEQAAVDADMADAEADMAADMAGMQAEMGGMMGGMGMGGMGMGGGMGMPGMGGASGAAPGGPAGGAAMTGGMKMTLDVDAVLLFDEAAGNLHKLTGRCGTSMNAMGTKTDQRSEFTLRFVGTR